MAPSACAHGPIPDVRLQYRSCCTASTTRAAAKCAWAHVACGAAAATHAPKACCVCSTCCWGCFRGRRRGEWCWRER